MSPLSNPHEMIIFYFDHNQQINEQTQSSKNRLLEIFKILKLPCSMKVPFLCL